MQNLQLWKCSLLHKAHIIFCQYNHSLKKYPRVQKYIFVVNRVSIHSRVLRYERYSPEAWQRLIVVLMLLSPQSFFYVVGERFRSSLIVLSCRGGLQSSESLCHHRVRDALHLLLLVLALRHRDPALHRGDVGSLCQRELVPRAP